MLRSQAILNALIDVRSRFDDVETTDVHGAVLTLTRTSTLAITTAGTTITWQSEVRGYQITWSGTDITIPSTGWYLMTLAWQTGSLNDLLVRLVVNAVTVQVTSTIGDVNRDAGTATFMRHFTSGDVVQINVLPSANVNLNVVAESGTAESPILNIVQLSGGIG